MNLKENKIAFCAYFSPNQEVDEDSGPMKMYKIETLLKLTQPGSNLFEG